MQDATDIQAPQDNWVELWRAPFLFRSMYDSGKYLAGTSLEELPTPHQHSNIATLSLDPGDATLVISWKWQANGKLYSPVVRYSSDGGPSHAQLELVKNGPPERFAPQFIPNNLPTALLNDAMNAITGAVSLRHRLTEEFFYAVDAGICKVFARIGSRLAPFTFIPADMFRAYRITSWGSGQVGQSEARRDGEPTLYALYVMGVGALKGVESTNPKDGLKSFESPFWNVLQTVVWVAYRDSVKVGNLPSSSIVTGSIKAKLQGKGEIFHSAIEDILRELKLGNIRAYGIENGKGKLTPIENYLWANMIFRESDNGKTYAAPVDEITRIGATSWHDLQFEREKILELWPDSVGANERSSLGKSHPENLQNSRLSLKAKQGNRVLKRGRPQGSGSYNAADDALFPLIDEICNDKGISPTAATWTFVENINGAGSDENKVNRVVRKYRKKKTTGRNRD